jgi:hypothetical protein
MIFFNSPMATSIDTTSIWLSSLLMRDSENDADRIVVGQLTADLEHRPLEDALALLDTSASKEPGQFGLEHATFLLFPLVLPAVHQFVKLFVKKFVEGAASEAGKITATALKNRVSSVLENKEGPDIQRQALADLERCFAERAKAMNLPKSSYEDLLKDVRDNRRLLM